MSYEERDVAAAHPDDVRLAAYAEGTLAGSERTSVEAHLAECPECRVAATEVALLLDGPPKRRRWWIGGTAAAAAAAALVLLFVAEPLSDPDAGGGVIVRPGPDADRESVADIEVVAPAGAEAAPADSVRFIWRATSSDALYRLTLTDGAGRIVWEGTSSDTVLDLPGDIHLAGDTEYLWYLDAMLPDGGVATTGIRRLRVR